MIMKVGNHNLEEGAYTAYLAGPMSGIPKFNFPEFDRVAEELRGHGMNVISPAELDRAEVRKHALASEDGVFENGKLAGETWGDFLSRDIKIVADKVRGIVLMPGWLKSKGARLECFVAILCDKDVFEYNPRVTDSGRSGLTILPNAVALSYIMQNTI